MEMIVLIRLLHSHDLREIAKRSVPIMQHQLRNVTSERVHLHALDPMLMRLPLLGIDIFLEDKLASIIELKEWTRVHFSEINKSCSHSGLTDSELIHPSVDGLPHASIML